MILKQYLVFLIGAILCLCKVSDVIGGATEEQMWAAGNLMRDVCAPKFPKVTKEIADGIREGNLPNEKDPKCYVNCILEMMQTMKKGKFLYEGSLKQVEILMPDHFKEEYRTGLAKCKDAAVGIKNNCDAAYAIFTCLRAEITRFVFP
uniref:Odorant binding protein n=1 Tax=Calliphora stygia TaxID=145453 RepID=A0A068FBP9_CALSG|nr:odorant binding protein [Calliphora stygia]